MKLFATLGLSLLTVTGSFADTCNNPEGVYGVATSTAFALIYDMGRLSPLTDLAIQNDKLVISPVGLAKCQNVNGCHTLNSILIMQEDSMSTHFPSSLFNPVIFRQRMVIQYQRQQIAAMRPTTDPNRAWIPDHKLVHKNLSNSGGCSVHDWFEVQSPTGGRTTATQANLCSQLMFAGSQGTFNNGVCAADNPYLDVRYNETAASLIVGIDPPTSVANMTGAAINPTESINTCLYMDPQQSANGVPCSCSGVSGSLQPIGTGSPIYSCSSAVMTFTATVASLTP